MSIRSITADKNIINEAKETKELAALKSIEDRIDVVIVNAELKGKKPTVEEMTQKLIEKKLISDVSQVNLETGDITIEDYVMEGKLANYIITPGEEFYGDKNIVPTNAKYFDFTVDAKTGNATLTGVKSEYAVKAYQNGEPTKYTVVIKDGDNYIKDVVIPYEYVDEIGNKYAVTTIGPEAFRGVKGTGYTNVDEKFTSFVLPNTISQSGVGTFRDCISLKNVSISKGVTNISNNMFNGCSSLSNISIPNSVTSIGVYAFYGCSSLSNVNIPNSVTSIGNCAFHGCASLSSVKIPDSVTSIGVQAFQNCTNLSNINIPDKVTSLGQELFANCKSLSTIKIPETVTNIGNRVFFNCIKLNNIQIPYGIPSIGEYTFYNCTNLTSINIPDSVVSIGAYAFQGCSSLSSINIPKSVTQMGTLVFANWKNTQTINCEILESEKPDTWDAQWDYLNATMPRKAQINWGVSM